MVLRHNDVALLISIQLSQNVIDVEGAVVVVGWDFDRWLLPREVFQQLVGDLDPAVVSLQCISFLLVLLDDLVDTLLA